MTTDRWRSALLSLLAGLLCAALSLAVCFALLTLWVWIGLKGGGADCSLSDVLSIAYHSGFRCILTGGWAEGGIQALQAEIREASPLIMTGFSVAVAWKTGLYNLGAAGQFLLGAFGGLAFAALLNAPWYLDLVAAAVCGALGGCLTGWLKAKRGVPEAVSSLLTNWIALYGVQAVLNSASSLLSDIKRLEPQSFQHPAAVGFVLAAVIALMLWLILNHTTFGFELQACGDSLPTAQYAGINEKNRVLLSMVLAGALAGVGGGLYAFSDAASWASLRSGALPSYGFAGIAVALLASGSPLGVLFSALFVAHIRLGCGALDPAVFPLETGDVITGVFIFLCAFTMLFRRFFFRRFLQKSQGGVS